MKKTKSEFLKAVVGIALAVTFITCLLPATVFAEEISGDYDNLSWSLNDSTGTLTISGSGAMKSNSSTSYPWYTHESKVTDIVISDGVETIARNAFSYFGSLESVTIADTVTSIDDFAFYGCNNLKDVKLSNSLSSIGYMSFTSCTNLTSLALPDTITKIYGSAFFYSGIVGENLICSVPYENIEIDFQKEWAKIDYLKGYVKSLEAGNLQLSQNGSELPASPTIDDEYSKKTGSANGSETFLYKSAKWADDEKTQAELRLDFAFGQETEPLDVMLVVDTSGSMESDMNMLISSINDMANAMLKESSVDYRLAVASFGTDVTSIDFTDNYDDVEAFICSEEFYDEGSTRYAKGLGSAFEILNNRTDTSRKSIVIFMTDGYPTDENNGVLEADKIKNDLNLPIYSILYNLDESLTAEAIATDADHVYFAEENVLPEVMNGIILENIIATKLVDQINTEYFDLSKDENSLVLSYEDKGVVQYVDDAVSVSDTGEIVVDLEKLNPYISYTLTAMLDLKTNEAGKYDIGKFNTNDGNAELITKSGSIVNEVTSPELERDEKKTFTINTSVENGTITEKVVDIAEGSDVEILFSPDEGYVLSKIIVDGVEIKIEDPEQASYIFRNITEDHDIKVVYEKIGEQPTDEANTDPTGETGTDPTGETGTDPTGKPGTVNNPKTASTGKSTVKTGEAAAIGTFILCVAAAAFLVVRQQLGRKKKNG